jgi:hypothetical protein
MGKIKLKMQRPVKCCSSKEALDDPWFSTRPLDRIPQFMPEMGDPEVVDIPQLDRFQVSPEPLAGIQLRGIGGGPLKMDMRRGPIG